jgi:hypothetical protein
MVILAAVSLMGLSACNGDDALNANNNDWVNGTSNTSPAPTGSDSPTNATGLYVGPADVEKYVSKFVDDAKAQGVDVTPDMDNPKLIIQFGDLSAYGSSVIGLCESGSNQRTVTFNPSFWNSVDDTQRELLAHHELGHCVLYRPHRSDLLQSGAYASIMYPIIMSNSTYTGNYAYYQQELFGNAGAVQLDENGKQKKVIYIDTQEDVGL